MKSQQRNKSGATEGNSVLASFSNSLETRAVHGLNKKFILS